MRPLGAKKTHVHCQNQRCAICRPCWPAKGGKVADSRAAEKQASRDADAAALADGYKTREQLRHENGLIRIARIDWNGVRAPR